MVAEQGVPAEPAVKKSRAGRDLPAAILVGLGLAATVIFTRHVRQRIDGHTGDTIGASQQVSEIAFLLALAMIV